MLSKSAKCKVQSAKLWSRQNGPACRQAGQTLVELVVVIGVLVIVVGALVFATIASIRNASFSKNQAQATKLAQEGIERVRSGRDRNQDVGIPETSVTSWNGDNTNCPDNVTSLWCNQISSGCGSAPLSCYFNIRSGGDLDYLAQSSTFPSSGAEPIPAAAPIFYRAIIISDDPANFEIQKTITSIVRWTDFSGSHESRLTTILRRR